MEGEQLMTRWQESAIETLEQRTRATLREGQTWEPGQPVSDNGAVLLTIFYGVPGEIEHRFISFLLEQIELAGFPVGPGQPFPPFDEAFTKAVKSYQGGIGTLEDVGAESYKLWGPSEPDIHEGLTFTDEQIEGEAHAYGTLGYTQHILIRDLVHIATFRGTTTQSTAKRSREQVEFLLREIRAWGA